MGTYLHPRPNRPRGCSPTPPRPHKIFRFCRRPHFIPTAVIPIPYRPSIKQESKVRAVARWPDGVC